MTELSKKFIELIVDQSKRMFNNEVDEVDKVDDLLNEINTLLLLDQHQSDNIGLIHEDEVYKTEPIVEFVDVTIRQKPMNFDLVGFWETYLKKLKKDLKECEDIEHDRYRYDSRENIKESIKRHKRREQKSCASQLISVLAYLIAKETPRLKMRRSNATEVWEYDLKEVEHLIDPELIVKKKIGYGGYNEQSIKHFVDLYIKPFLI